MAKKKNKKVLKAPKTEEKLVEAENKELEMEIVEPDATLDNKNSKVESKAETKAENKSETKTDSKKDKNNGKKPKDKKAKKSNKLVRKVKETFSELKKVSWPTFRATCKSTGVVIIVVVIFTLVLFGIDRGLAALYNLIPR